MQQESSLSELSFCCLCAALYLYRCKWQQDYFCKQLLGFFSGLFENLRSEHLSFNSFQSYATTCNKSLCKKGIIYWFCVCFPSPFFCKLIISGDEICVMCDIQENLNNLPRYLHLGKLSWTTLKKDADNSRMKLNLILWLCAYGKPSKSCSIRSACFPQLLSRDPGQGSCDIEVYTVPIKVRTEESHQIIL